MKDLKPRDHAEAVALFRSEIVGALTRRDLDRGELRAALEELATRRYRPPGSPRTRRYGASTLERWYYAYRKGGLAAQRDLLLNIRSEHPSASVPLILRTLVLDGRLDAGAVSQATVRRLYRENGLDRVPARDGKSPKARFRWCAEAPGALWHGDVCHGPAIEIAGKKEPLRIHGMLDDTSRYLVALEAHHSEKEVDMLGLMVRAFRRHGPPDAIYLDNGSTYRGDILRTACGRMNITLMHARPYDPQSRGKMERFWRTLREGCLDHLGTVSSLHDANVRLWAFLDQHYHRAPHGGLLGRPPESVYREGHSRVDDLDEEKLREALTVRVRRRVRRDTTVSIDGEDWELEVPGARPQVLGPDPGSARPAGAGGRNRAAQCPAAAPRRDGGRVGRGARRSPTHLVLSRSSPRAQPRLATRLAPDGLRASVTQLRQPLSEAVVHLPDPVPAASIEECVHAPAEIAAAHTDHCGRSDVEEPGYSGRRQALGQPVHHLEAADRAVVGGLLKGTLESASLRTGKLGYGRHERGPLVVGCLWSDSTISERPLSLQALTAAVADPESRTIV